MKPQHFITAFALVLLSVSVFSCVQEESTPTLVETTAVQADIAFDATKLFPLPDFLQELPEDKLAAHLKTLTKQDMDDMAAAYAEELHAKTLPTNGPNGMYDCIFCAFNTNPPYPIEWSVPGYFVLVHPQLHRFNHGCPCDQIHQYWAIRVY